MPGLEVRALKFPADAPEWLKAAVANLEENSERAILNEDPARACGYAAAVFHLKAAITDQADSLEQRRLKELHELTWGADGKPAS